MSLAESAGVALAIFAVLVLSVHIRPPRHSARARTLATLSFLMSTMLCACFVVLITRSGHGARDLLAAGAAFCGGLLVWLSRGSSDDGGGDDPDPPSVEPPPSWDWHDFDRRRAVWEGHVPRPRVHA
jgi:hypothetical protein